MYLLVMEDGSIGTLKEVNDSHKSYANNGYADLIDISGPYPLSYYNNRWNEIEEWDEGQ